MTKEKAFEKLLTIYHKTRITDGFYVPYEIVAALLDKPQQRLRYEDRQPRVKTYDDTIWFEDKQ